MRITVAIATDLIINENHCIAIATDLRITIAHRSLNENHCIAIATDLLMRITV